MFRTDHTKNLLSKVRRLISFFLRMSLLSIIFTILLVLCLLQYLSDKPVEHFYAIKRESSLNHNVYTVQDLHNPEKDKP